MKNVQQAFAGKAKLNVMVGTKDVLARGDEIVGKWRVIGATNFEGRIAVNFLNCRPDVESICAFTLRYGPLEGRPVINVNSPLNPPAFSFKIEHWKELQAQARERWRILSEGGSRNPLQYALFKQDLGRWYESISLFTNPGFLTVKVVDLFRFVLVEMSVMSRRELGYCPRRSCKTPFFERIDLRANYCSRRCATLGTKVKKLDWWNEKGKEKRREKREDSR